MARKLSLVLALLALTLVMTGASFANSITNQITFGPSTAGTVVVGNSGASLTGVSGAALLHYSDGTSSSVGTFALSNINVSFGSFSPQTQAPGSGFFTVQIGPVVLTGWLSLDTVVPIGSKYVFFAGSFNVTSASSMFAAAGFPVGAVTDIDFTTRFGALSSGELTSVPEPGTIALVGSGLLAAAGMLRRKL